MRAAIYARVSTSDKDQNPVTQLLPLREFVQAQGWQTVAEFVDHASGNDLRGRTAWRDLLEHAARHKVDLVLVWRIDRAFRSVHEAALAARHISVQLRAWVSATARGSTTPVMLTVPGGDRGEIEHD